MSGEADGSALAVDVERTSGGLHGAEIDASHRAIIQRERPVRRERSEPREDSFSGCIDGVHGVSVRRGQNEAIGLERGTVFDELLETPRVDALESCPECTGGAERLSVDRRLCFGARAIERIGLRSQVQVRRMALCFGGDGIHQNQCFEKRGRRRAGIGSGNLERLEPGRQS